MTQLTMVLNTDSFPFGEVELVKNSLRNMVQTLGRRASERPTPFRAEAEGVLASFRVGRQELETKIKRGDLTPKVAREQAEALAGGIARALKARAGEFSSTPRVFLDRLVEASETRRLAAERTSLEGLQRETNRLLRSVLVEQQIQVRQPEFESRAFARPVGGGQPAPTLDGLLTFCQSATMAGDDAAAEWGRRQLEGYRAVVTNPDDHRRIDLATDRPDRVNPRLVGNYVEAMDGRGPEDLERFVSESISSKDANACMASFIMAREAPEGSRLRWVRLVLDGVNAFPDAAITTLRELEVEARSADRDAAIAQADFVLAQVEAEARLHGIEAPSASEVARRAAMEARPAAKLGEPIGLALDRRGAFEGDQIVTPTESPEIG
jgi:hypothetical protein